MLVQQAMSAHADRMSGMSAAERLDRLRAETTGMSTAERLHVMNVCGVTDTLGLHAYRSGDLGLPTNRPVM